MPPVLLVVMTVCQKRIIYANGTLFEFVFKQFYFHRLKDYEDRKPNDWLIAQSYFLVTNAQNILELTDDVSAALLNLERADILIAKIDEDEIKLSPALQRFKIDIKDAICPDDVHIAATPPSSAAIFFSTQSTVGFVNLE